MTKAWIGLFAIAVGVSSAGCSMETGASNDSEGPEAETVERVQEPVVLCNGDLDHTYLASFGRAPNVSEQSYWCSRNVDWGQMDTYGKNWLTTSAGRTEQSAVITRVYQNVYSRSPSSSERSYWMEQSAAHGGYLFSEMVPWLASYGQTYGQYAGSFQYWCFNLWGVQLCSSNKYSVTPG